MSLNIKNPRVHELAREAARRTGKSQTSVIEEALERYVRDLDEQGRSRLDRVDWILRDVDARLTDADRAAVRRVLLEMYDEATGLPA